MFGAPAPSPVVGDFPPLQHCPLCSGEGLKGFRVCFIHINILVDYHIKVNVNKSL